MASEAELVKQVWSEAKTVAVVGATNKDTMPVYDVMKFLQAQGYRCIPVNPGAAQRGEEILGQQAFASVGDIPEQVDIVDIFLRSDRVAPVFEEAMTKGVKTIWTQIGVEDEAAALAARARGFNVIMNRCPAIDIPSLSIPTPKSRM